MKVLIDRESSKHLNLMYEAAGEVEQSNDSFAVIWRIGAGPGLRAWVSRIFPELSRFPRVSGLPHWIPTCCPTPILHSVSPSFITCTMGAPHHLELNKHPLLLSFGPYHLRNWLAHLLG